MDRKEIMAQFERGECLKGVLPTDKKRILIPVFGFDGATMCSFVDWEGKKQTRLGFAFHNPNDAGSNEKNQVVAVKDGSFILYDGPGRQKSVAEYLKKHPDAVKTTKGLEALVDFLTKMVEKDKGKGDLWETDTAFIANKLLNAPALKDIKPGQVIVSAKKQEATRAVYVPEGTKFVGARGQGQTAKKKGAYIVEKMEDGKPTYDLVQFDEFHEAYDAGSQIVTTIEEGEHHTKLEDSDWIRTTTMAGKHVLTSMVTNSPIVTSRAFFDGDWLSLAFEEHEGTMPKIDWVASYHGLKKENPAAAGFIRDVMMTPEQREQIATKARGVGAVVQGLFGRKPGKTKPQGKGSKSCYP